MWKEITMNMWLIRHLLGPSVTGSSSQQIFVVYLLWAWNSASSAKINKSLRWQKAAEGLASATQMQTHYSAAVPWDHPTALTGKTQSGNSEEGWFTVTSATARGEQDTDGKGAGDVPVNSASSRIRRISPSKDRQRTFVKILVGEQMFGDL